MPAAHPPFDDGSRALGGGSVWAGGAPRSVRPGDADVQVSGYSVIEADSQEQLDGLLEGHPHTAAGGTVSSQRFMEMPGM